MQKNKIKYHVMHLSARLNMMITEFEKLIPLQVFAFDKTLTFDLIISKRVTEQLVDQTFFIQIQNL